MKLNTEQAKADFTSFSQNDLDDKYTLIIRSVTATDTPPGLTATGSITFATVFSRYGFSDVSFEFEVSAVNFEVGV